MNSQDWSPLGLTGLLSLQFKGLSRVFSSTTVQKYQFFSAQSSLWSNSHLYMTIWTFVGKVISLLFNMLSRLVIAFLPRSKYLLISWLQSPSAVILEPLKIVSHCFNCFPICHEVMGPDAMIFVFWMLSFKPTFSLSSFTFIKRLFSFSSLSAIRVVTFSREIKTPRKISQARLLEWVAIPFSRGSSRPWGLLHCRQILYHLSHQGNPLKNK